MATASFTSPPAPSKLYNLDITIVNAKHLKNVNRRQGDHRPYIIFWVDPDRRLATKPDYSGTTRLVWNEHFVLPLSLPPRDSLLTLVIFHSRPSETSKPLVGTLRIELRDLLVDSNESSIRVKSFEVKRPSGRLRGPSPPPPQPFFDRQSSYGGPGPSAPVDYAPYDHQKRGSGKFGMGGMGSGLVVGAVARALWRAGIGRRDKVRGREDS
ncbi:Calcium-dependent lipid-binding (CaLB domain) family protein [Abeliophyllum distichum]|uniref:Calcium-dependent lipid-binding (CaLB domain) family protein n=1 Tax=Abeliophyllum distichum TaxID=126358 RepID=A0ABD1P3V1_9LAMI